MAILHVDAPGPHRATVALAIVAAAALGVAAAQWLATPAAPPAPTVRAGAPAAAHAAAAAPMPEPMPMPARPADAPAPRPVPAAPARPPEAPWHERNPDIEPRMLTIHRLRTAEALLREVALRPNGRGGYVVMQVPADSPWARLGLREGDVLYSIDTEANALDDEDSLLAAMQRTRLEMQIYRQQQPLLLSLRLDAE